MFGDIGRQRHLAELIQLFIEGLGIVVEVNQLVPIGQCFLHLGGQRAVTEGQPGPRLHPASRAGQTFPGIPMRLAKQKNLAHGARGNLDPHQAGRKDLGVVDHQNIPGVEIFRQIPKNAVCDGAIAAVKNHQPCAVPGIGGFLRNQLFGQIVPKIFF